MKTKQGLNRLLAICALLHVVMLGYATIAYPGLVEFKQPNGNIVKVTMRGSETLKWAETEDGYTLMYDSIGNLVYAELDAMGDLVPSNVIATDRDFRPAEVEMRLMATPKRLAYSQRQMAMAEQVQQARSRQMAQMASSGAPAVGTRKMLLILVDFPDYPFQKTKEDFELLMNQLNYTDDGRYGSVRDFYRENSFGQLDLIHDVVGVYRLQYERAYYGGNTGYSNDNDPRQMALEAVTMAAADVNFADYDNDGDGTVDGVHIIYAGPGEEAGGGGDCIWAHSWTVSATVDGVRTYRYSCSPEIRGSGGSKMTHIGVICHEIGHVLGAMDFYDTNYGTGGQYPGTGKWDLMASGNWNGDGACPAHFNPYSKIYDYGWAAPADGNQAASFTLDAKSKDGFVRIDTQTDGEFFLLEYRAKSGFDLCVPFHGLMVYRASDGMSRMSANTLNAYHKQQFYPLVANAPNEIPTSVASTYGSVNTSTAPFPGSLGIDELTDFTTPSMKSWIGVNTEFPITSIKEDVAGESVTFDIAGGIEGGAYSFKVTDSDTLSITFGWKTPASETVVLAFSKEPTFGVPENRTYTVGETITGGGEVIYVGKELSFKHSGLEQQEEYYYKLFTLRADGTYTAGRQLKAETATGVIRKFPYEEDFSLMLLPTTWRHELIIGDEPWKVDELKYVSGYEFIGTGDWMLMCEASLTLRRRARVVMPVIDFTDATCAALSFDYRNFLQIFEVEYRTSPTDEWHLLRSFDSQWYETAADTTTVNGVQHVDIKLPMLSSNYEIAFVADYTYLGNVISSSERLTVDNIKLQTDFKGLVSTQRPTFVSSTMAKVEAMALEGTEKITAKGVQWSTDKSSWTTVKADEDGVSVLTSLPIGTTIYYRGYATIVSGEALYGDVQSFTTFSFTTGSGTEADPYLIGSTADWTVLRTYIDAGNDCTGLTFALENSFTLTNSTTIMGIFNGTLDGKGNTITLTATSLDALFQEIGPEGSLTNMTIHIESTTTSDVVWSGLYCMNNWGTISRCKTYIGTLIGTEGGPCSCAGICNKNFGLIYSCESEIYRGGGVDMLRAAGICLYNSGTIIGCSFKGELASNNNLGVAGIACANFAPNGLISDCVNYGKMEIYLNDEGEAWSVDVGGICKSNSGWIQRCVNKGAIAADGDEYVSSGGIAGGNDGTIIDCYNLGEITVSNHSTSAQTVSVGGIAGSGSLGSIRNAFSLKNIMLDGTKTSYINGVIGTNNQTEIENCYYWGSDTESYAIRCEYADLCSEEMIRKLNNNGADVWVLKDGIPALKWEQTGVMMAKDLKVDLEATRAGLSWIVFGDNVASSGLEWRKKGTIAWTREQGECNQPSSVELTGLEPVTIYEARVYAVTSAGETLTTPIETFATLFESKGTEDDPHLITDYNQLLAFSEIIAHGYKMGGELVRLCADIDLKGNKGILWEPIRSKLGENSFEGEFDGQGHVLSHMYIDTKKCYAGFFGLFRGYVHDLTIVNSEIKCNTVPSTSSYYAGVGGLVGSSVWYSSVYPYIVQRCGFEGRIIGGNAIGGIIGAVATVDAVSDCYANVDITYSQKLESYSRKTGVGGVVGKGNALNSYATGTITFNNTIGVSYGPVAGLYYNASNSNVNSYYDIVCNKSYTNSSDDISMAATEMASDAFLNSLTAGVWTRADHLNEGYPVFASRDVSCVTTSDAGHTANGDVEISAIYMAGADKEYHTHGFQWYSKMGDAMNIIETVIEGADDTYVLTIPNHQVSDEGVNYRAFAAQEGDSIFGEWKSFIPTFRSPQLQISDITVVDRNTATLEYVITAGTKEVVYTFEYAGVYEPDSVVSLPVDEALTKFSVANIKKMQEYKGVLVAATDAGIRVESEPFAWSQRTATAHALTYMIGDSVAAVHYYEPGDVIDAVVVKDVFGLEFSGWEGLPATMPDNDLIVTGEYVKYIVFADAAVESICLTNWDANDDGKLSLEEAAAVTDLGTVFKNNSKIKTFDELKYFTGLTKIGSSTFYYCTSLEFVSFPKTIKTIEASVFYGCSNLKSLVIPASVTSFSSGLNYKYCRKLASIVVEEGNQVYDSRDNCNAVIQKSSNTLMLGCMNTIIPNTVKEIGAYAFDNCYGLLKIEVPESVTKIANNAFSACIGLTEVNLPISLECIGSSAFEGCRNLSSLYIPSNVKDVGVLCFTRCYNLQKIEVDPNNVTYDSRDNCNAIIKTATNELIAGCSNTTIPNTISIIGEQAFGTCVNLLSINIPMSTTKIRNNAFRRCSGLTSVKLASSVKSIEHHAFADCVGLTEFIVCWDTPVTINGDVFSSVDIGSVVLYVPVGTKALYEAAEVWKDFGTIAEMPSIIANDIVVEYGSEIPALTYSSNVEVEGTPLMSCVATSTSPVGTYPIRVSQGSVVENEELTYVDGTLTIVKAPLTISAGSYTKKQGEENPKFTAFYSGFKNGETASVLTKQPTFTTDVTASTAPGQYAVKVSGAEAQNYEISHVDGTITVTDADKVTITANNITMVYGDAVPELTYASSDELIGVPQLSCSATSKSPVGTYPITISKGSVENYNVEYVSGTLTIVKAPLTISAGSYTKKQGEENPNFTATYSGFRNGETASVLTKQPTFTTDVVASTVPGQYAVKVSGAEAQNYEISYVDGTITVTEADKVTVTANNITMVYGDAVPELTYASEGAELLGAPIVSCEATSFSPVGTYPITISKGYVENYNVEYINGTLTIVKAPLHVMADDCTRAYGEENPVFTVSYEGWVNDEDEEVLTKSATVSCMADEATDVGVYDIVVSGAEAMNYSFTYTNGRLTIEKAMQEIVWEQDLASAIIGDQVELTATATSGLEITYQLANNDIAEIYEANGKSYLDCLSVGQVVIKAIQNGDKNYHAAMRVNKTLVVSNPDGIKDVVDENADAPIYNMLGEQMGCSREELQRGVYIQNGRKFVVK